MNIPYDVVNAMFELTAGFVLMFNVREILREKRVVGVHIAPAAFFTLWGIWNAFYYPAIAQQWSFYAAILVVVVNSLWVALALMYRKQRYDSKEDST